MTGFSADNPKHSNEVGRAFAIHHSETLASLNLRMLDRDDSNSIQLRDHLKLLSKSAASIQHRLILAANGNAKKRSIRQKQLTNSIAMMTGVIAQLELLSTDLPVEVEELEQAEETRLQVTADRSKLEKSMSADAAVTDNVPLAELTERKRGRRPKQSLENLIELYSEEDQEQMRINEKSMTLQQKFDVLRDY